jgi:Na+-transporting NADH:ubiquinone oxidoreductase subunit NqrC
VFFKSCLTPSAVSKAFVAAGLEEEEEEKQEEKQEAQIAASSSVLLRKEENKVKTDAEEIKSIFAQMVHAVSIELQGQVISIAESPSPKRRRTTLDDSQGPEVDEEEEEL